MQTLWQDVQFAVRQLRRSPGFALVAIVTLALAVGVSTAVFSVLDATIVRPLPFNQPERIVDLQTLSPQGYGQPASWLQYLDWRRENRTLSALAGFDTSSANLEASTQASPVRAVYGTDNFFDVFAVKPLLGRGFLPGEDQQGNGDVAVLSYELWTQTFGGRSDIVGAQVKIDGTPHRVVGVMPAGFRFPLGVVSAVYLPFQLPKTRIERRNQHFLRTLGRLKPGVTREQAEQDMTHVFANLGRVYPDEAGGRITLATLADATLGDTAAPLRVLTLAVAGVLLIGCINLAGLLLARGVRRQRELSLRAAIGAGRARLVRQLLTESALLALAGGAAGVLVAAGLLQAMRQLLVHSLARGADVHLNMAALAAALAIAITAGLAAGALPALQSSSVAPSLALRTGGGAGVSRGQSRLRGGFITAQVAVALGLLVCSGLLLRNLHSLRSTDLGFSPQNLLTEEIFLTASNYGGRDLLTGFYEPLLYEVRGIAGIQSSGLINILPIQDWGSNSDIQIVGQPPAPINQERLAENRFMTPGTIETLGGHLVSGRMLDGALDRKDTALSTTVNQAFARKFFLNGESPIGHQIDWGGIKVNIVGVTSDMRQSLTRAPMAEMDFLLAQIPDAYRVESMTRLILVLRTSVPPAAVAGPMRAALHKVDASVPFRLPATMQDVIADTLTFERLESWLFSIFGALALSLSLVGIYGMVHLEVELRTRDIGVRMALGSTRGRVVGQILSKVAVLMGFGIGLGWALTLALRRVLASVIELHAVQDGMLLAVITATLAIVGVGAGVLPARRAATIDPIEALRAE